MSMKDIPDHLVCKAFVDSKALNWLRSADELLAEWTGQPRKVCYRAMERAHRNGLVEYGVSLRTGWVTERGVHLLDVHGESTAAPHI